MEFQILTISIILWTEDTPVMCLLSDLPPPTAASVCVRREPTWGWAGLGWAGAGLGRKFAIKPITALCSQQQDYSYPGKSASIGTEIGLFGSGVTRHLAVTHRYDTRRMLTCPNALNANDRFIKDICLHFYSVDVAAHIQYTGCQFLQIFNMNCCMKILYWNCC